MKLLTRSAMWHLGVAFLVTVIGRSAEALPILMTLDGASLSNREKAETLGHEVATTTLAQLNTMSQGVLAGYRAVFVSPDLPFTSYGHLRVAVADGGSLQLYVASGGTLVLNVAGRLGDQQNIAPGGVDYLGSPSHNAESISNPAHPFITGVGMGGIPLTKAAFDDWLNTDHGYLNSASLPIGAKTILTNTDGSELLGAATAPSLVEYPYGAGRVLVSVLTIGWAAGGEAGGAPQENLIRYALIPEPAGLWLLLAGVALTRRKAAR